MTHSALSFNQLLTSTLDLGFDLGRGLVRGLFNRNDDERLKSMIQDFNLGRDVIFGALVLSQEGICSENDIIPWSALRSFQYEKRELILVRQRGNHFGSLRFPVSKLKDLPLLLHLLQQNSQQKVTVLTH